MQTTLGHYRVIEPIGSGGMGAVYLARDERLERDVAIKVLSGAGPIDDEARRRFRKEALALSKLNHPNVATIHDFTTFDDQDVLVMEHIPGRDLADVVRDGPLPEAEIVRIGQQLLSALEAAHARHIIHRDLKPGNVRLTTDGRVKVLDFGLAQALAVGGDATTASLSAPGFAGTLPYMAPEQVRGDAVDARTDIYGAGAVLYEMATGTRVHPGLTGPRLLGAILEEPPLPARGLNPRISPALEAILCKALDRDPRLRYQSAREMSVDLERLAAPERAAAPRPVWQRRRVLAVAAGLLAGALALGGWLLWPADPFTGRILVADFDDRTGDPELALVLRDLLTLQLQQSRHLNVLSRDQVVDALRRMGRDGADDLILDTAAELAEREGIPLILAGTARRSGSTMLIAVQGVAPISRAPLFTKIAEYETGGDPRRSISTLARDIRQHLGESLAGIAQGTLPLEQVTTPSLDALKLYSRGTEANRRGDPNTAQRLLSQALARDPTFAMAHRAIARAYATEGKAPQARDHLQQAYEFRERLTQRERLLVEGSYYHGQGLYEKAVASFTAYISLYPAESGVLYELARAYRDAGDTLKAIERLEELLLSDPRFTPAYGTLVLELARAGQYDRATAAYQDARRRGIESPVLEWGYGLVLLGRDRIDDARTHFSALESSGGVLAGTARFYFVTADVLEGRLAAAAERLRTDILGDRQSAALAAEVKRRYLLGQILVLRNQPAEAVVQARYVLEAAPDQLGAEEWLLAGTLLAELGDVPRARSVLEQLHRTRTDAPSRFNEFCYQSLAGAIALAENRSQDALQAFSSAAANYARAMTASGLARVFMDQQDWPRAREAWTRLIESRGELLFFGLAADWVLAHLERARASRQMGDVTAARADYEAFLEMWKHAGDLPVIVEAQAEYRSLRLSTP